MTKIVQRRIAVILIALAIIAAILVGVFVLIRNSTTPDFTDGSEISVVNLTTNSGTLYEWTVSIENPDIVELVDKTSSSDSDEIGSEIEIHYAYKGKKPGTTTATFKYGSFADGEVLQTKKYRMEVNQSLDIKITEL